ncbi:MAG: hypothetical protein KME47_09875 [Nodosilinea sp. WJT8-NPBG4]|jgi:hypothetical protein|nr:hypothetical protein [Nodosilinea sp. WJT8-NPBG4]
MKTAYASFNHNATHSDEFLVTEAYMSELGKQYALEGKSLPVKVNLPGRPFPFHIKRSRHEWACAFTDSYFATKKDLSK